MICINTDLPKGTSFSMTLSVELKVDFRTVAVSHNPTLIDFFIESISHIFFLQQNYFREISIKNVCFGRERVREVIENKIEFMHLCVFFT